jgi:hypothetical protein
VIDQLRPATARDRALCDQFLRTPVWVGAGSPVLTPRHMSKPRPDRADTAPIEPTDLARP